MKLDYHENEEDELECSGSVIFLNLDAIGNVGKNPT